MESEPAGGRDGPEGGRPSPGDELTVRIRYTETLGDHLRAGMWAARQSDVQVGMGIVALLTVPVAAIVDAPELLLFLLVLGSGMATGWLAVPIVWWAVRGQPGLVGSETETVIDRTGIHERSARLTAHVPWSTYRRVVETRDAFYLSTGLGYGFLAKRALDDAQLAAMRRLVADAGLLRRPRRLRRVAVTIAVFLVLLAIALLPIALQRLNVSARIELAPALEGEVAHVRGTTDLPDGAFARG